MHFVHCTERNARQRKCFYNMPRWLLLVAQFQKKRKKKTVWIVAVIALDSCSSHCTACHRYREREWWKIERYYKMAYMLRRGQFAIIITIRWTFSPEGKKIVFITFICQRCSLHSPFRSHPKPFTLKIFSEKPYCLGWFSQWASYLASWIHKWPRCYSSLVSLNIYLNLRIATYIWNFQMTVFVIKTKKRAEKRKHYICFMGTNPEHSDYVPSILVFGTCGAVNTSLRIQPKHEFAYRVVVCRCNA